jgi:hypothetical protein
MFAAIGDDSDFVDWFSVGANGDGDVETLFIQIHGVQQLMACGDSSECCGHQDCPRG